MCAETYIKSPAASVTVQARPEWPARDYFFFDVKQARMFAFSCKQDDDCVVVLREIPA